MNPHSLLCARHDGAMLGFLLFLNRFQFARARYPIFRKRMQLLLDGLSAGIVLPASHDEFTATFSAVYTQVLSALTEKSLFFFPFALGCGFLAMAMKMPNQTDIGMLHTIMNDLKLPVSLFESHVASVPEIGDQTSIDDIMSPALAFLRDVIQPLDIEPDTCFVAMPFSDPFEEQYPSFYKPLMRDAGYRTLRAWGGLATEFHVDLLLTLIDKSGAVLAELTGLNPNVVLELGYAYGRDKVAIPLCDSARPIALANLYGLAILPYDSSKPDWQNDFLQGLGRLMLKALLQVARGEAHSSTD